MEILADDESGQRELEFSNLSKGWCKGEEKFIKAHFKNLKEKELALVTARQQGVRWGELEEIRELVWDQRLKEYAEHFKIDLGNLGRKNLL